MKTSVLLFAGFSAVMMQSGCTVTREYRTYEEFRDARPSEVRVMTQDTTLYELKGVTLLDSTLSGWGVHLVDGKKITFDGVIPLRHIVYIQAEEPYFLKGLLGTAVVAGTAGLISKSWEHDGLKIYWPTGGSCPYVYVRDAGGYVVQGEAFGTAFGKGLETSTTCVLPAAMAQTGGVRVRMTNERPETHYVNAAALFAYDVPNNASLCLDSDNRAWAITDPRPPTSPAADFLRGDGRWWKSDLGTTHLGGTCRDVIEISMPHPDGSTEASLVVHAVNTRLIKAVYDVVFGYLGDESLRFLHEVENNRELIGNLRGWIGECSLRLEIFRDGRWVEAGMIPPEANDVPFSRVVRIEASGVPRGDLRIRLSALADSWMIDAVEIDWTPAVPLEAYAVPLRSAGHSVRGPSEEALCRTDDRYTLMVPGESIDMQFEPFHGRTTGHLEYAFAAGGYLYEWLPAPSGVGSVHAMFASLGPDKLAVVNALVRNRDAFLWPLYARWKEMVGQHAEMRCAPGE